MSTTATNSQNQQFGSGMSKVYILDKYFHELQKFWDTEKRLQDATSSGEAEIYQRSLRTITSGLVGLRNCLHEQQEGATNMMPPAFVCSNYFQDTSQSSSCNNTNTNSATGGGGLGGLSRHNSANDSNSSAMTPNVSDPGGHPGMDVNNTSGQLNHGCSNDENISQLSSPPKPVSTLVQHNYSNIHQPIPRGPTSLTSSRTQSSNTSPVLTGSPLNLNGEGGAFTKPQPSGQSTNTISSRPRTPPEERVARREKMVLEEAKKSRLADINDLIHLDSPITEDAVIRTLQSRYVNQKYVTNIGPIVLSVNSFREIGNPLTLTSTQEVTCPELAKVVEEAVRLQNESGYPQTIIVSGSSGSGKTFASMLLLKQIFSMNGGLESDTFKQLSAAFTVLRSLGSAQTASNRESSRIGHFIEAQVSSGELYRTKIHCYFLDQGRVVKPPPTEKSYHIFYQMMAGLNPEERSQLGLDGLSIKDLNYLNIGDTRQDELSDAQRFADWKFNLAVLGIPFMDVVRVLSAILLMGNVEFAPRLGDESFDVEVFGKEELSKVAKLLGISSTMLWQGITTRTHTIKGQPVKSMSDANTCNATRDALAKALYCRTVATIVRRANSLKRPTTGSGATMSTESTDSVHHEVSSLHASTVGTSSSRKSNKSMALLNHALKHATDGFIGILDMFGFEDSKPSQLEQLCINLCSETMQHFYNTHIFKSSIESCREEGITYDVSIDYVDNVPCIDLISSLRTGLLSMLDVECSLRGCSETYIQKIKVQHKDNKKLFEPNHCDLSRTFGIHHYAGPVIYDSSQFLDTNRDTIPDDLICVFAKDNCNFGFASHLFGNEMRSLGNGDVQPRGATFRISPTSTSHINGNIDTLLNGDEPVSTLTQDFHTRLDNLLRTLVHAKPHFVRCLKPNEHNSQSEFDRTHLANQIRSLQVLETVNLMARGFPHRMRFKAFNARYRALAQPMKFLHRTDSKAVEDCEFILDCYNNQLKSLPVSMTTTPSSSVNKNNNNNKDWAHGRKHIFLSEGARQLLEMLRETRRQKAALIIQKLWRGYSYRKTMKKTPINNNVVWNHHSNAVNNLNMMIHQRGQRPKPIAGTPPPLEEQSPRHQEWQQQQQWQQQDRCDFRIIQQTCSLFGLDLERPPPVPPRRTYTVAGNKRITFPQTRMMKQNYSDVGSSDMMLLRGETVVVIGHSTKIGHLVVERNNHTIHVPFQFLELKKLF